MNPLCNIAVNFGTDEAVARNDAKTLSAVLNEPVLFWQEDGTWFVLPSEKALGKHLGFVYELIHSK